MMRIIRIAGNTQIPNLWVIEKKYGYETYSFDDTDEAYCGWLAKKGERVFFATCPEALLGLIVMHQELGDDWQSFGEGDFYDKIMSRKFNDKKLNKKRRIW